MSRKMRIQGVAGSRALGEAIDQRRFALGFKAQTDLARELGWDKSKLSAIVNGRKGLTGTDVKLLMHELEVSEEWLRDPEGQTEAPASGSNLDQRRAEALAEYLHYFARYLASKGADDPDILDGDGPATQAAKATLAERGRLPSPASSAASRLEQLVERVEKAVERVEREGPAEQPKARTRPDRRRGARSSAPPSE